MSNDESSQILAIAEADSIEAHGGGAIVAAGGPRAAALVSVQRQQMNALAKAGQENAILTAVRKQMEALEDKLSVQIVRVQTQGDKLREAAFSRYDNKLGMMETNQPRVDRRMAELTGNLRGLSDEMQNQIRRIDSTDSRLFEWRHQLEEEIRMKLGEIEQNYQQVASTIRVHKATSDDSIKKYNQRLLRLEGLMEERVASAEDTNQSILQLHNRLTEVEDCAAERERTMAITMSPYTHSNIAEKEFSLVAAGSLSVTSMESKVQDLLRSFDSLQGESNELSERVESQEERFKSLRTLTEAKEEQYRALTDRLERDNFDGRLREVQARVHDFDVARVESVEQFEILRRKLDGTDACNQELGNAIRRLQERSTESLGGGALSGYDGTPGSLALYGFGEGSFGGSFGEGLDGEQLAAACVARVKDVECRVDSLHIEVETMRADQDLGSRVAMLVGALKDVAPKVINHDTLLKQLHQDLGEAMVLCTQRHVEMERTLGGVRGNVERLGVEVERLVAEVEGGDGGLGLLGAPIAEEVKAERGSRKV